ncbi:MAG: GGDEF domain-containing protein [Nitrospinae bacterium]|nr:GGDEF domain-containing protein [Nitrospinota bacterium]
MENRDKKLQLIQRVLDKINAGYKAEEVMSFTTDIVKELFKCQSMAIFTKEPNFRNKIITSRGLSGDFIKHFQADEKQELFRDILSQQRYILINESSDTKKKELYRFEHDFKTTLAVPMKHGNKWVGFTYMDSSEKDGFSEEDIRIFVELVNLLTVIVEYGRLEDQLHQVGSYDGLTRLYSYKYFHESLSHEIKRAVHDKTHLTLCVAAVDHLKDYNHINGHPKGDKAMQLIGSIIKENVRDIDIPARYGGAKFVIIMPACEIAEVKKIAETIRKKVETAPFEGKEPRLYLSIALTAYPVDALDERDLINKIDQTLYFCRREKGNIVKAYSEIA